MLFVPALPKTTPLAIIDIIGEAGLRSGLAMVVDIGDQHTYSGSDTLSDVSGQSRHLTFTGASGTARTAAGQFSGSIGGQSSSEYLTLVDTPDNSAGDRLIYNQNSDTFMRALHKDGAQFTIALLVRTSSDSGVGEVVALFSNNDAPIDASGVFIGYRADTDEIVFYNLHGTSGSGAQAIVDGPAPTWVHGQLNLLILSYDEVTGAWIIRLNGSQAAGTQTYTSPVTTDLPNIVVADRSAVTPADARFYGMAAWNRALSSAEVTALYNGLKSRFGI